MKILFECQRLYNNDIIATSGCPQELKHYYKSPYEDSYLELTYSEEQGLFVAGIDGITSSSDAELYNLLSASATENSVLGKRLSTSAAGGIVMVDNIYYIEEGTVKKCEYDHKVFFPAV